MRRILKLMAVLIISINLVGCGQGQDQQADHPVNTDTSQSQGTQQPSQSSDTSQATEPIDYLQELLNTVTSETSSYHGTCGENITWYFVDDSILILKGSGPMVSTEDGYSNNYNYKSTSWYNNETINKNTKTAIIDSGITSISTLAFTNLGSLEEVRIPDTVEIIEFGAFAGCKSLKSIHIPSSVKEIDAAAFEECKSLETVTGAEGLVILDNGVFNQSGLTNINIPPTLTEIGHRAFAGTPWIMDQLDDGKVQFIVVNNILMAYNNYNSIEKETANIVIPSNVKIIGAGAFEKCYDIETITMGSSVEAIKDGAFLECRNLTSIKLSDNLKSIGYGTFYGCKALEEIELPDSLEAIGAVAFEECESLKEIIIPEGVTELGDETFMKCKRLTTVGLPTSLEVIGSNVFFDTNIKGWSASNDYLQIKMCPNIKKIKPNSFNNTPYLTHLAVAADENNGFVVIENLLFTYAGEDMLQITIPDTVKYVNPNAFAASGAQSIKKIIVPEGVECLHEYSFYGCIALEEIQLPASITSIGEGIFNERADVTIFCKAGSFVENYAKQNSLKYVNY